MIANPNQEVVPFFQGVTFRYPCDHISCWSTWVTVYPDFTPIAAEALRIFRAHVVPQLKRFSFGLQLHNRWLPTDTAMKIQHAMPEIRLIHLTIDEAFHSGSEELKKNVFASNSIINGRFRNSELRERGRERKRRIRECNIMDCKFFFCNCR